MLKHLPDCWISPIVWFSLRKNFNLKIIVSSLKKSWRCHDIFNINHNHVLSCFLKRIIKSLFIFSSLPFSVRNKSSSISNEDKNSALIGSVERSNIGDRIRRKENHGKLLWIKDLILLWFKVSFRSWTPIVLELTFTIHRSFLWHFLIDCYLSLLICHCIMVIFQIFSSSEFFKHYHFIFSHFRCNIQKFIFLLLLGQINYITPTLFIFRFKCFEEIIKCFILLGHFTNTFVEWTTLFSFLTFHKFL